MAAARTQEILSTRQQAFLEAWRADLNGSGFYQASRKPISRSRPRTSSAC